MGQDKTISQLTVADNLTGDEKLVFAKNGANGAVSAETFKAYAREGLSPKEALFIDLWNNACGSYGRYNAETGYFELNGLTDITYAQALEIYNYGKTAWPNPTTIGSYCRTNILTHYDWDAYQENSSLVNMNKVVWFARNIEVLRLAPGGGTINTTTFGLHKCNNLKKVIGTISLYSIHNPIDWIAFNECKKLEEIRLSCLHVNAMIVCPRISYDSMQYLVAHATNASPITITVHPDVYVKLIGNNNLLINSELREVVAGENNMACAIYFLIGTVKANKNDEFIVSVENIENLAGNPTEYSVLFYGEGQPQSYIITSDQPSITITAQNSGTVRELRLYAGKANQTAGNSVRFTNVRLEKVGTPTLSPEEAAAWQQLVTDAAAKQITFATA